jgi:hypothetical protein
VLTNEKTKTKKQKTTYNNHAVSGVMVSVLIWSVVNHGFESLSGQIKNYAISICCFYGKHVALREQSLVGSESG